MKVTTFLVTDEISIVCISGKISERLIRSTAYVNCREEKEEEEGC